MGRKKRSWSTCRYYHIVMRGNNRQNIFREKKDYEWFLINLLNVNTTYRFELLAYCLMTNHYHLLLRSFEAPLGKVMQLINVRYSRYYHRKYHTSGHLFGTRYYAQDVFDVNGFLQVSRYIHRNPIETSQPMVQQLEKYPYSSFPAYKQKVPFHSLVNPTILPELYASQTPKPTTFYWEFCEEADSPRVEEL